MGKKAVVYFVTFIFAFGVLFASIFRSASVNYAFSENVTPIEYDVPEVDYLLPGTGVVGPDDPIWFLEVIRDKARISINNDNLSKAEQLLLIADKRIAYAEQLHHRRQYDESIAVAEKAEMYLIESLNHLNKGDYGTETSAFMHELALSSLKHREILELMYIKSPNEARPKISSVITTPKNVFEKVTHLMNEHQVSPVHNPFLTN